MSKPHGKSLGRLLASFLQGAWRKSPPEPLISGDELSEIAPLLMGSGAGALAWWKIRGSRLREASAGRELERSYRLHILHALLFQQKAGKAFNILRRAGIEPVLIKGWANARLYPEAGLRPYGDVDLCVKPEQYETAAGLMLKTQEGKECTVDLHKGLGRLDGRSWEEFYGRSRVLELDGVRVRLLSPEDHLHVLCVHMLEGGAWRPIQLCDVAAAVEAATPGFDWELCLGTNKRRANWVASSIALAHHLLGARLDHVPAKIRDAEMPGWLLPAVLRHWDRPCIGDHPLPEAFLKTLRHPARLPKALAVRWPDPIGATIRLNGSFNALPRLPFQIGDYFMLSGKYLMRLPKLMRGRQ